MGLAVRFAPRPPLPRHLLGTPHRPYFLLRPAALLAADALTARFKHSLPPSQRGRPPEVRRPERSLCLRATDGRQGVLGVRRTRRQITPVTRREERRHDAGALPGRGHGAGPQPVRFDGGQSESRAASERRKFPVGYACVPVRPWIGNSGAVLA